MIPQYDFDNSYDTEQTNVDRNVMNTGEMNERTGFVISTAYENREQARSGRYGAVEFTDTSVDFADPFEDDEILSGKVTPKVAGYYDTGYDGVPNVYDPSVDHVGRGAVSLGNVEGKKIEGKMPKEAFGLPELFKSPADLLVATVVVSAVIIIEIIGLFLIFGS